MVRPAFILLPLLLAEGIGDEGQRPLAYVVISGLPHPPRLPSLLSRQPTAGWKDFTRAVTGMSHRHSRQTQHPGGNDAQNRKTRILSNSLKKYAIILKCFLQRSFQGHSFIKSLPTSSPSRSTLSTGQDVSVVLGRP